MADYGHLTQAFVKMIQDKKIKYNFKKIMVKFIVYGKENN